MAYRAVTVPQKSRHSHYDLPAKKFVRLDGYQCFRCERRIAPDERCIINGTYSICDKCALRELQKLAMTSEKWKAKLEDYVQAFKIAFPDQKLKLAILRGK